MRRVTCSVRFLSLADIQPRLLKKTCSQEDASRLFVIGPLPAQSCTCYCPLLSSPADQACDCNAAVGLLHSKGHLKMFICWFFTSTCVVLYLGSRRAKSIVVLSNNRIVVLSKIDHFFPF
jgi:hypothetical protein